MTKTFNRQTGIPPGRRKPKPKLENQYGVDDPVARIAFAMIYLSTGMLPEGFNESWKQELGRGRKERA